MLKTISRMGSKVFPATDNLIINGAMQVAQRGTSTSSITSAGYFTADRWLFDPITMGTWTESVENDAPTGSGFRKSLKVLATTADATPAAGDVVYVEQKLEGQNCQRIAKGTALAQQLTVSFWVKANVTGTYIAMLYDNDNTRHVCASYTVSASATWERKTITFPADTTGPLDNDNASSLWLRFWLGAGSNNTSGTLATTWASYNAANAAVGQTNLAAATNNYWQVTGVQLEVGPIASPFVFKSYGQELAECQRYYEKTYNDGQAPGTATPHASTTGGMIGVGGANTASTTDYFSRWTFKVNKRTTPTVTIYDDQGNSGKILTWSGLAGTSNVTPTNAAWSNNETGIYVWHSANIAGFQYHAVASAEL